MLQAQMGLIQNQLLIMADNASSDLDPEAKHRLKMMLATAVPPTREPQAGSSKQEPRRAPAPVMLPAAAFRQAANLTLPTGLHLAPAQMAQAQSLQRRQSNEGFRSYPYQGSQPQKKW